MGVFQFLELVYVDIESTSDSRFSTGFLVFQSIVQSFGVDCFCVIVTVLHTLWSVSDDVGGSCDCDLTEPEGDID